MESRLDSNHFNVMLESCSISYYYKFQINWTQKLIDFFNKVSRVNKFFHER